MIKWKEVPCVVLCAVAALPTQVASAQAVRVIGRRPTPKISVNFITISALPNTVNFNLVEGGVATGSLPVTVVTNWVGIGLLSTVQIYASLASATTALSGGAPVTSIPSSCVFGQDPKGIPTSYTPFTQSGPSPGSSLLLFNTGAILTLGSQTQTDVLSLKIDLTSMPKLPVGSYTGVLTLTIQSF
jgi:hypothetical protein